MVEIFLSVLEFDGHAHPHIWLIDAPFFRIFNLGSRFFYLRFGRSGEEVEKRQLLRLGLFSFDKLSLMRCQFSNCCALLTGEGS